MRTDSLTEKDDSKSDPSKSFLNEDSRMLKRIQGTVEKYKNKYQNPNVTLLFFNRIGRNHSGSYACLLRFQ